MDGASLQSLQSEEVLSSPPGKVPGSKKLIVAGIAGFIILLLLTFTIFRKQKKSELPASPKSATKNTTVQDPGKLTTSLSPACMVKSVIKTDEKRQNTEKGGGYAQPITSPVDASNTYSGSYDETSQKFQLYNNATCLTCNIKNSTYPLVDTDKNPVKIDPTGQYLLAQVEVANHQFPKQKVNPGFGTWFDLWMYDIKNDVWSNLTNYPSTVTGDPSKISIYGSLIPQITSDWKTLIWAEEYEYVPGKKGVGFASGDLGNIGHWRITTATINKKDNTFSLSDITHFFPGSNSSDNVNFYETQDISPDNRWVLFTSDIHKDSYWKLDLYKLDLANPSAEPILITNFRSHENNWNEHGEFTTDGTKIIYESTRTSKIFTITDAVKTLSSEEFMVNSDGSGPVAQLTHFNEPGYPESQTGMDILFAERGKFSTDGTSLTIGSQERGWPNGSFALLPASYWKIAFVGNCANEKNNIFSPSSTQSHVH